MGRAPCCEKIGLRRGRWTAEEDETLINYIQANGEGSWRSLPKNAGLLRCGKSCRLRWINYLRADLKRGNFTAEEEETIVKLHRSLGNRWSSIASHFPGRTDNEIKNYWNSHLSRKIYNFFTSQGESTQTSMVISKKVISTKRRLGRVSRCAAKKYNKDKLLHSPTTKTETLPNIEINDSERQGICNLTSSDKSEEKVECRENEVLEETEMTAMDLEIMNFNYVEETEMATMDLDIVKKTDYNEERENGDLSLKGSEEMHDSASPLMSSCFDDGMIDWDWEGGFEGITVGDEGENMLLWLWEDDPF